ASPAHLAARRPGAAQIDRLHSLGIGFVFNDLDDDDTTDKEQAKVDADLEFTDDEDDSRLGKALAPAGDEDDSEMEG
ncbi:hypothetical protein HAX54_051362, partial [Datura stramonium]|nr:hypothetical protein [Datura stramonium]